MTCKWCKDTGLYYPLQGKPEPCRECAAAAHVTFDAAVLALGMMAELPIGTTVYIRKPSPYRTEIERISAEVPGD